MNKLLLRDRILDQLRAALELQVGAAQLARDEAISEESKPENQYDTHSLEAGYLAEGQARQAAEIEESLKSLSALAIPPFGAGAPIALGALVEVRDPRGVTETYFFCPRAGGLEIEFDDRRVQVVTPSSPLGRQLLGRQVGATVQLPGRKTGGASTIVTVQ